jgi:hypothetical protein
MCKDSAIDVYGQAGSADRSPPIQIMPKETQKSLSRANFSVRLGAMNVLTHDAIARLAPPECLALIAQLWESLENEPLPATGTTG